MRIQLVTDVLQKIFSKFKGFYLVEFKTNKFSEQIQKDVDRSLLCFENFENCSEEDL